MRTSRFTTEQIIGFSKQAEVGMSPRWKRPLGKHCSPGHKPDWCRPMLHWHSKDPPKPCATWRLHWSGKRSVKAKVSEAPCASRPAKSFAYSDLPDRSFRYLLTNLL